MSRPNPFKTFIEKVNNPEPEPQPQPEPASESVKEISNFEPNLDYSQSNENNYSQSYSDPEQAWVQYIDDESGMPYLYNEVTGEAKWIDYDQNYNSEESNAVNNNEKVENPNINYLMDALGGSIDDYTEPANPSIKNTNIETSGENYESIENGSKSIFNREDWPWEKFYDDDGYPFYFNKITGASEWEIPADELLKYGFSFQNIENQGQSSKLYTDEKATVNNEETLNSPNQILESSNDPLEESNKSIKSIPSFRSVRSARSLGLHSAIKDTISKVGSFSENNFLNTSGSFRNSNKDLKSLLSFSISRAPSVDDSLKPKTPLKRKSKNGFQMMKEGSKVLRQAKDQNGDIWVEYQSADDGPIFYALKESDGGQWLKPSAFINRDLASMTPVKLNDLTEVATPESSSEVVVNYFDIDNEDVLQMKTPISQKITNENKSPSQKEIVQDPSIETPQKDAPILQNTNQSTPLISKPSIESQIELTDKLDNKKSDNLITLKIDNPQDSHEPINKINPNEKAIISAPLNDSSTSPENIIPPTTQTTNTAELKIKNIQAEALEELNQLRNRLEQAKFTYTSVNTIDNEDLDKKINSANLESSQIPDSVSNIISPKSKSVSFDVKPTPTEQVNKEISPKVQVSDKPSIEELKPAAPPNQQILSTSFHSLPGSSLEDSLSIDLLEMKDEWTLMIERSQIIQSSGPWDCFFDTSLGKRFFKNRETGLCQYEKPFEFIDNSVIKNKLPSNPPIQGSNQTLDIINPNKITNPEPVEVIPPSSSANPNLSLAVIAAPTVPDTFKEDVQTTKELPKPIDPKPIDKIQKPTIELKNDLEVKETPRAISSKGTTPREGALKPLLRPSIDDLLSPSYKERKLNEFSEDPKQDQKLKNTEIILIPSVPLIDSKELPTKIDSDSTFLTNILAMEKSLPQPSSSASPVKSKVLDKKLLTPPPELEENIEELKFAEKTASKEFHAYLQRDYQTQDDEAHLLLQRLQAINGEVIESLRASKLSKSYLVANSLASMDKDGIVKIIMRCRAIIERCCAVLEQVETSPIEHIINERQLLNFATQQRLSLLNPKDYQHDAPAYRFTPPDLLAPHSFFLTNYWNSRTPVGKTDYWDIYKINTGNQFSTFSGKETKLLYRHNHTKIMQQGEPFDITMKRSVKGMKVLKWNDFEANSFVDQRTLEHLGINFLSDENGGYLFYCPIRDSFSSSGIFDGLKSNSQLGVYSMTHATSTSSLHWQKLNHINLRDQILHPKDNIWNRFHLKRSIQEYEGFFTTNMSFDPSNPSLSRSKSQSKFKFSQSLETYRQAFQKTQTNSKNPETSLMVSSVTSEDFRSPNKLKSSLKKTEKNNSTLKQSGIAIQDDEDIEAKNATKKEEEVHFSLLQEAFAIIEQDSLYGVDDFADQADDNFDDQNVESKEDLLSKELEFEKAMNSDVYQKYASIILNIGSNKDNPLPVFELMELLIYEGLGKPALAVFKHGLDSLKQIEMSSGISVQYEASIGEILYMKLCQKYYNYHEKFDSLFRLMRSFPTSTFLLPYLASYFMKIQLYDWSEILLQSSLMQNIGPTKQTIENQEMTLLTYAHLLVKLGDMRQAQRYLYRVVELNSSSPWNRIAKIELAWIQELISEKSADELEATILMYKNALINNKRDRIQSLIYHSLGCLYADNPWCKSYELSFDYFKRAISVDEDNAMTYLGYATLSVLHKAKESINTSHMKQDGLFDSNVLNQNNIDEMKGTSSGVKRPSSANATTRSSTPLRPKSANSHSRTKLANSKSANEESNQDNSLSIIQIDSSYRKGLVLMANSSYRWIALLSYADFISCTLVDCKRAKEYYQEAVKLSFSTQIWPILALGHFYQYVLNDYASAKRLYTRAVRSRHIWASSSRLEDLTAFHGSNSTTSSVHPNGFSNTEDEDEQFLSMGTVPFQDLRQSHILENLDSTELQDRLDAKVLYVAIAYLFWDRKQIPLARRYAIAALKLQRDFTPALRCLGLISYFAGQKRLGYRYLTSAIDYGLETPEALRSYGLLKAMKNQYDQAIQLFERALEIHPYCPLSHRILGIFYYFYRNQTDKALQHLQLAYDQQLKLEGESKEDIESLRIKSQILMDLRQFNEARICLLHILRIVPYDSIAFANLGICVYSLSLSRHPESTFTPQDYKTYYTKELTYNKLEILANSKDPYQLFETSLLINNKESLLPKQSIHENLSHVYWAEKIPDLYYEPDTAQFRNNDLHSTCSTSRPNQMDIGESLQWQDEIDNFPLASKTEAASYVYYLYGCLELAQGTKETIPRARLLLLTASKLGEYSSYQPLILYQLGVISELEDDLYQAEKYYEEAIDVQDMDPIVLLRLIGHIEDNLEAIQDKIDSFKLPSQRRKKKKKKSAKNNSSKPNETLADDMHSPIRNRLGQSENIKKTVSAEVLFSNVFDRDDDLNLQDFQKEEKRKKFGEISQDEDESSPKERKKKDKKDFFMPPSQEMSHLLRRVMIHQRILENASVKRFSYQKLLKDMNQIQVPKTSYVFLDHDWIERCLYSFAKCENWARMMSCVNT